MGALPLNGARGERRPSKFLSALCRGSLARFTASSQQNTGCNHGARLALITPALFSPEDYGCHPCAPVGPHHPAPLPPASPVLTGEEGEAGLNHSKQGILSPSLPGGVGEGPGERGWGVRASRLGELLVPDPVRLV